MIIRIIIILCALNYIDGLSLHVKGRQLEILIVFNCKDGNAQLLSAVQIPFSVHVSQSTR